MQLIKNLSNGGYPINSIQFNRESIKNFCIKSDRIWYKSLYPISCFLSIYSIFTTHHHTANVKYGAMGLDSEIFYVQDLINKKGSCVLLRNSCNIIRSMGNE